MRSVTLLVSPDQAAKVELGQNRGTLHLSLRNPNDTAPGSGRPATLADLRLYQEQPAGRPWDERAKDFLKALSATLAQASRPKPEEPKVVPAPPRKLIRTIRGGNGEGTVELTPGSNDRG
jgi:hypothetical protein